MKCIIKNEVSRDIVAENIDICIGNVKKYLEIDPKGAAVEDNIICLISIMTSLEDPLILEDYKVRALNYRNHLVFQRGSCLCLWTY